jgi:aspartyl/asparaginyl-tRNA synthetase
MKQTVVYSNLVKALRQFFESKGYIEVPTQSRLSILAACENPFSVSKFEWSGEVWPLPQTGQMWLEYELLKNPHWEGVFCISTSYRAEKDPIPGRHETIFPMFEFESKGGIETLKELEIELLSYLGWEAPFEIMYDTACNILKTDIIEAEHEGMLCDMFGNDAVMIKDFPRRSHPFWNMKQLNGELYSKIDVVLHGQETIGSAERSCSVEEMTKNFYSIMDGAYCEKLFNEFGEYRVKKELEEYLSLEFFERFGGGIGLTRLARAMSLNKGN